MEDKHDAGFRVCVRRTPGPVVTERGQKLAPMQFLTASVEVKTELLAWAPERHNRQSGQQNPPPAATHADSRNSHYLSMNVGAHILAFRGLR